MAEIIKVEDPSGWAVFVNNPYSALENDRIYVGRLGKWDFDGSGYIGAIMSLSNPGNLPKLPQIYARSVEEADAFLTGYADIILHYTKQWWEDVNDAIASRVRTMMEAAERNDNDENTGGLFT